MAIYLCLRERVCSGCRSCVLYWRPCRYCVLMAGGGWEWELSGKTLCYHSGPYQKNKNFLSCSIRLNDALIVVSPTSLRLATVSRTPANVAGSNGSRAASPPPFTCCTSYLDTSMATISLASSPTKCLSAAKVSFVSHLRHNFLTIWKRSALHLCTHFIM